MIYMYAHKYKYIYIYMKEKEKVTNVRMQKWMHEWLTEMNYNHLLKIFFHILVKRNEESKQ